MVSLINHRQYAIVSQLRDAGQPVAIGEMRESPWYMVLYEKLTDKTKQRDLTRLKG